MLTYADVCACCRHVAAQQPHAIRLRDLTNKYTALGLHAGIAVGTIAHSSTSFWTRMRRHTSAGQHTSAYVSIRQPAVGTIAHSSTSLWTHVTQRRPDLSSAYVSIRQHTSAYVSIRQQYVSNASYRGVLTCLHSVYSSFPCVSLSKYLNFITCLHSVYSSFPCVSLIKNFITLLFTLLTVDVSRCRMEVHSQY